MSASLTLRVRTLVPFYVAAGAAFFIALVVLTWGRWGSNILINPTRSAPMGLYRIRPHREQEYRRGMAVVFPVPRSFRALVYGRGWLRSGVPLLKTIAALAGDQVCVDDARFEVNENVHDFS